MDWRISYFPAPSSTSGYRKESATNGNSRLCSMHVFGVQSEDLACPHDTLPHVWSSKGEYHDSAPRKIQAAAPREWSLLCPLHLLALEILEGRYSKPVKCNIVAPSISQDAVRNIKHTLSYSTQRRPWRFDSSFDGHVSSLCPRDGIRSRTRVLALSTQCTWATPAFLGRKLHPDRYA